MTVTLPTTAIRVRVSDLLVGDVLVGSSRTVQAAPGRSPRRGHSQLVVTDSAGRSALVQWRSRTMVYVRRPTPVPPPRADLDG